MPISIQRAQEIVNEIAADFGVSQPPPIYVSNDVPKRYAGMYFHGQPILEHIVIRPEFFSDRTIAHETGHWLFHTLRPGECDGGNPECEEIACMVENWWVDQQKKLGLLTEDWK